MGRIAAEDVDALLDRAAELARGGPPAVNRAGADLIGRDLRRVDLGAADLRGAYLIRADLRRADLALADLRGADLRAPTCAARGWSDALFLTRSQLGAAVGDETTTVPSWLERPAHWLRRHGR